MEPVYKSIDIFPMLTVTAEEFEDNKGVIRSHRSKQDRQYNGEQKKAKSLYS
jgi:hypothetical protein